ncbi:Fas-binding factor 1 [Mytilus galloprovincialis]|uniref:Fas-binding factor 1 n=1 Tax=Mytilus galloprovincialis TaxID=29158 RepID=A0A8B6DF26_MYTGA|nr:Fas-binding factor 1 [Mytilus galloprovincialis]VDI17788.1 Fas-binding factor 1 [Mytilus galloprovincialis]
MANAWTPGGKKQQKGKKGSDGLDDLLGDLLHEDSSPKKKSPPSHAPAVRTRSQEGKKQGSKDEDFYSNIAASAEDGLSDVSEADVKEMAQSIKDLEDMDADLFGGKLKKKGSTKGGSSSKTNTPRRGGTPRSRSTTPRAVSPQQRVTSPQARVTSPTSKSPVGAGGPSSTWDQPISPRGGSRERPGSAGSKGGVTWSDQPTSPRGVSRDRPGSGGRKAEASVPVYKQQDVTIPKPSTAPGKMNDIYNGNGSESLRPGATPPTERPGTVPKAKPKFDFGEFNEDDPLAGLLSDDEDDDSWATKPAAKRSSLKKKEEPVVKKQEPEPVKVVEEPKKNLYDRPPTRSGSDKKVDEEPETAVSKQVAASKKKEDAGIFSDDDDFLGGLGIEDKGSAPSTASKPKPEIEDFDSDSEEKPAPRMFDKLLGKDSNVTKHLETKERKEFVLDKKYTQPDEEDEEDYAFGSYMPSAGSASGGSRPGSRRSVRFQDEDDIFGFDKPPSRGRSPATKKPEGMEWLDHMSPSPRSTPTKETVGKDETTPAKESQIKDAPSKEPTSALKSSTPPVAKTPSKTMNKPKVDPFEYLGLKDDEDDGFEWMKPKQPDVRPGTGEQRLAPVTPPQSKVPDHLKFEQKPVEVDQSPDDYLGLGGEVDLDSMLKKTPDSPLFGGSRVSESQKDLFSTPAKIDHTPTWESGSRRKNSRSGSADRGADLSFQRQSSISDDVKISEHPSTQLQQKDISQHDFLSNQSESTFQSSKPEPNFLSHRQEPDFLSSKPESETRTTDFFNFSMADKQRQKEARLQSSPEKGSYPSDQMSQQQMQAFLQLQQQQYQQMLQTQQPMSSVQSDTFARNSGMTLGMDPEARIRKLEIEIDCANSLLESTKRRHQDEIKDIESSYNTRLQMLEETHTSKEKRLREENEYMMSQHLTKIRGIEQDKSDIITQNFKKIEEIEREKMEDLSKVKEIHRNAIEQLRKDHEESIQRLKSAKNSQIEAVAISHDTTRSLAVAVEMIQTNARDVGELQKKLDQWHSMGMDEREIAIRSKDEQLKILQERLRKQQDDNDNERKRLEDLITRLETQIREQSRVHDEERWSLKQEHNRMQSLQTTLEEERRLWTEQQARERTNIEKIRESLLEEQKSVLTQLHRERQALAEERTQFMVTQKTRRDDLENYTVKLSQAKTEFDAIMKVISEEKNKSYSRKEELTKEEQRIEEEGSKLQSEKAKQKAKEDELIEHAQLIKEKSEQVDEYYLEANSKYEEGMMALEASQRIEAEENQRLDKIHKQMQSLQNKEKQISEERLRLSKEKKEVENLRSAALCPNCRSPSSGNKMVVMQTNGHMTNGTVSDQFPGVPATTYPVHYQNTSRPPSGHVSLNSVTESIKADRSIRMWKMEAFKDQKYLEEESLFLYTLKQMPYSNP